MTGCDLSPGTAADIAGHIAGHIAATNRQSRRPRASGCATGGRDGAAESSPPSRVNVTNAIAGRFDESRMANCMPS